MLSPVLTHREPSPVDFEIQVRHNQCVNVHSRLCACVRVCVFFKSLTVHISVCMCVCTVWSQPESPPVVGTVAFAASLAAVLKG